MKVYSTKKYDKVVVFDNGQHYALEGWNGEAYFKCFEIDDQDNFCINSSDVTIYPIYKQVDEDEFEIIGYEKC